MVEKQTIVARLGEERLLLPEMIASGLCANDQVKYYFALLQTARSNCDSPHIPTPDLKAERLACGINESSWDTVVANSMRKGPDIYAIPESPRIFDCIVQGIKKMLDPLAAETQKDLEQRLENQSAALAGFVADENIQGQIVDAITSGDKNKGDSLHLIVMDAHRALNQLQHDFAMEQIDGAHVYNLSSGSRKPVAAFMAGINRTAPLKFDHPGLGTTATEYGGQLIIQNDIGTTDAHVLVIKIAGTGVTYTYTDIHLPRLNFFQSLFNRTETSWEKTARMRDDAFETSGYYMATATFRGADEQELEKYLEFLGSRLVFLIDWNKARKRLRKFVGKKNAIKLLEWAAENNYGHRGFLEIGGEDALFEAVEFASGSRLRYGDRLDKVLGLERTEEFLRFTLRVSANGLLQKRSGRVIKDELKTRLSSYFESAYIGLLVLAGMHGEYVFELATALRDAMFSLQMEENRKVFEKQARRAAKWESKADDIFNQARSDARRIKDASKLLRFFERADDAADHLEDAVSILPLVSRVITGPGNIAPILEFSDQIVEIVKEFIRCIENGISATRTDTQADMDDFLNSADRMVQLEHDADELFRSIREKLVVSVDNFQELFLLMELVRMIESATNSLTHGSQILRNYIMELSLG